MSSARSLERRRTWKRRRVTIPAMLSVTACALLFAPLLLVGCLAVDVVRGRRRLTTLRAYLFSLQYLVNDSVEILAAGPLWLIAGLGRNLNGTSSIRRHQRLQAWSIRVLARRAEQLLGIGVEIDERSEEALGDGPAIVLCRHVSLFDASLPALLYLRRDRHTSGVVMAELLADPGFDLLYQRSGSVFIERDNSAEAIAAVQGFAAKLAPGSIVVIFPEGRLFRPELLEKSLTRLRDCDPTRFDQVSELTHLLPPRVGGFSALLDAFPEADVVVINHAGLDCCPAFADVARNAPLPSNVRVAVHRIHRRDIPVDVAERSRWLDEQWLAMDRWVQQTLTITGSG